MESPPKEEKWKKISKFALKHHQVLNNLHNISLTFFVFTNAVT